MRCSLDLIHFADGVLVVCKGSVVRHGVDLPPHGKPALRNASTAQRIAARREEGTAVRVCAVDLFA